MMTRGFLPERIPNHLCHHMQRHAQVYKKHLYSISTCPKIVYFNYHCVSWLVCTWCIYNSCETHIMLLNLQIIIIIIINNNNIKSYIWYTMAHMHINARIPNTYESVNENRKRFIKIYQLYNSLIAPVKHVSGIYMYTWTEIFGILISILCYSTFILISLEK